MVDPFADAYRSADRYAKARELAVDLEVGDAWAYGMFGGMGLFVFGAMFIVLLNGEGAPDGPVVWPAFVFFFGILVLVLSAASVFAVPLVGLVERVFLPWSVRRVRIEAESLPVSLVVRAVDVLSPRRPRFPSSFSRYGSHVDIATEAARRVVSAVENVAGGARLLDMVRSLNVSGELNASADVSATEASRALSVLDDMRFSLLLALVYLESAQARSEREYHVLQVGPTAIRLASELGVMPGHQVGFCLDVVQSSRWDGSAGDLLDTARLISA